MRRLGEVRVLSNDFPTGASQQNISQLTVPVFHLQVLHLPIHLFTLPDLLITLPAVPCILRHQFHFFFAIHYFFQSFWIPSYRYNHHSPAVFHNKCRGFRHVSKQKWDSMLLSNSERLVGWQRVLGDISISPSPSKHVIRGLFTCTGLENRSTSTPAGTAKLKKYLYICTSIVPKRETTFRTILPPGFNSARSRAAASVASLSRSRDVHAVT